MTRNTLYLFLGALVVAVAVLGYYVYQERQKSSSVQIDIGEEGLTIETR